MDMNNFGNRKVEGSCRETDRHRETEIDKVREKKFMVMLEAIW